MQFEHLYNSIINNLHILKIFFFQQETKCQASIAQNVCVSTFTFVGRAVIKKISYSLYLHSENRLSFYC